ncbi:MAG TPA: lytic transglycosylase domain-containing protein [Hyphomicrobiales bacterium]|nr:lytic transglycosylase domain-containing protein [Hyphomicrobiales bacterium]
MLITPEIAPWRRTARAALAAALLATSAPALAAAPPLPASRPPALAAMPPPVGSTGDSLCLMIESAATASRLPIGFFTRIIWQESSFRADAVGPATRSGEHALGIAQFMPGTAAERGLGDPFDPVEALPRSAELLRDLADRFGNLGLAAAAYNAGPARVADWLAGHGSLPAETQDYVLAVTGTGADDWAAASRHPAAALPSPTPRGPQDCRTLYAMRTRAPNPLVAALEGRIATVATSPWGIVLAAGFARGRLLAAYARIEKRLGPLLAGHPPSILRSIDRSRGWRSFYQVRAGAPSRGAAEQACAAIRRHGGACAVLRNRRVAGR